MKRQEDIQKKMEDFEKRCRDSGVKITPQRLAVYRELISRKDHPSAEDIYSTLKEKMPGISLPTIYRTLNFLEEKGLIMRVPTIGDKIRYDGEIKPHSHFICKSCNKIFDLEEEAAFEKKKLEEMGFHSEKCILVCFGLCPECSSSEKGH